MGSKSSGIFKAPKFRWQIPAKKRKNCQVLCPEKLTFLTLEKEIFTFFYFFKPKSCDWYKIRNRGNSYQENVKL